MAIAAFRAQRKFMKKFTITEELLSLARIAASRTPPVEAVPSECVRSASSGGTAMYSNHNERLNIEFNVERLDFAGIQTMDPRLLRIPPGRNNERHRHAHESLFVVLEGEGNVLIGETRVPLKKGDVAFVPRWLFHQTTNTGDTDLVVVAITDFGFTYAVMGEDAHQARLRNVSTDSPKKHDIVGEEESIDKENII
jgi:mannose-6-phosphate isomerase-like protein (cupin superfamily)